MTRRLKNVAASVKQRLRNQVTQLKTDYQLTATRYVLERLIYRMSASAHSGDFVLKGAMLFPAWTDQLIRPTRDLDLWRADSPSSQQLAQAFHDILTMPVESDGVEFDVDEIAVRYIRADMEDAGVRVTTTAQLGDENYSVQVDIGFGDVITPAPREITYPAILDFPEPRLRAYPQETVVAEKFHAMIQLGLRTSRIKDFNDVAAMARLFDFDGSTLMQAIKNTFANVGTDLPTERPVSLMPEFANAPQSIAGWPKVTRFEAALLHGESMVDILEEVATFALPPVFAAARQEPFDKRWPAGGPWT